MTTRLLVLAALPLACARDAKPAATPAPSANMQPAAGPMTTSPPQPMGDVTAFVDPGAERRQPVQNAIAVLRAPDGARIGTVRFVGTGQAGLDVVATVEGLSPGTHAYHVHVYGDCSAPDGKSAGPHFHFTGSSHDTSVKMITGDLGELVIDREGRATHQTRVPEARLQGPFSLIGRSVVVHAKGNDPSKPPDGGAGDRIACGVIGIENPGTGAQSPHTSG